MSDKLKKKLFILSRRMRETGTTLQGLEKIKKKSIREYIHVIKSFAQ